MKVLDSTFLIDLLRGKKETLAVINSKGPLLTTSVNMYEVIRGLFLRNMNPEKFAKASALFENINLLPLTENGIIKSAEISSSLIKKGTIVSDCDCLTAGIALSHDIFTIVTRNVKHFKRMEGIKVESY